MAGAVRRGVLAEKSTYVLQNLPREDLRLPGIEAELLEAVAGCLPEPRARQD